MKGEAKRRAATKPPQEEPEKKSWLEKRTSVGGLELHPLSVGIIMLLEAAGHPLMTGLGEGDALTLTQQGQAAFIFAQPVVAIEAQQAGRAAFDAAAQRLATQISPVDLNAIMAAIVAIVNEGIAQK